MLKLARDFREFIELLNEHEVRYLVVGGYAVGYHGWPRATGDIDFLLDATHQNAERVLAVLRDFGFGGLDVTTDDLTTAGTIVQFGIPPNRIDLVVTADGIDFADAWSGRVTDDLAGTQAKIIGLDALKANKAASGRPKDLADLDNLP